MADSEVRQKFEAPSETPDAFEQAWKEFNSSGVASGWEMVAFTSGFGKGFAAGMRAGEIARWIPVEEKLPRPNQLVLACYAADKMAVTWHTGETWVPITHEMPTHWQRLPAAPEEKKP